ncbi:MAG: hypothetical protein V1731_01345 [Candidatus Aenigmatarchaeota archaeon]
MKSAKGRRKKQISPSSVIVLIAAIVLIYSSLNFTMKQDDATYETTLGDIAKNITKYAGKSVKFDGIVSMEKFSENGQVFSRLSNITIDVSALHRANLAYAQGGNVMEGSPCVEFSAPIFTIYGTVSERNREIAVAVDKIVFKECYAPGAL